MQKNSIQANKIIDNLGFDRLNQMQEKMLQTLNKASEVVLLSPTGSGKTVGFLLPVVQHINIEKNTNQVVIIAPSRELAIQIEQVFKSMGTGLKVTCCYGGHSIQVEKNSLKHSPIIVVGTPGRIADHINRGNISVSTIHSLVLDEFDKSLELGFQQEMEYIIQQLSNLKRRILTSATRMDKIPEFTGMKSPVELDFLVESKVPKLTIHTVRAAGKDKLEVLFRLLCHLGNEPTLVFCNHREAVERISELLWQKNLTHEVFHGGMEQEDRERSLIKFRNGSHKLLITTDLAARGLDIPEIRHIVHYQLPVDEKSWTHRNGRTARMNADGNAYLVLSEQEYIPLFIKDTPNEIKLPESIEIPELPDWVTLYIGGGKKDKINKIDIVGFLLQKGQLEKHELGLIEVLDFFSYAAIKADKAQKVIKLIKNEAIKKKKVKIAISH